MACLCVPFTQCFPRGAVLGYNLHDSIVSFCEHYGNTYSRVICVISYLCRKKPLLRNYILLYQMFLLILLLLFNPYLRTYLLISEGEGGRGTGKGRGRNID